MHIPKYGPQYGHRYGPKYGHKTDTAIKKAHPIRETDRQVHFEIPPQGLEP